MLVLSDDALMLVHALKHLLLAKCDNYKVDVHANHGGHPIFTAKGAGAVHS